MLTEITLNTKKACKRVRPRKGGEGKRYTTKQHNVMSPTIVEAKEIELKISRTNFGIGKADAKGVHTSKDN